MSERAKEHHREYMRRYNAKKRAAGLCLSCSQPAEPGKTRCAKHLRGAKNQTWEQAQARRAAGLCVKCGGERESGRYLYCATCRKREMEREYRGTPDERKERWRQRSARSRARKKERGECQNCQRPALPDDVLCAIHREKRSTYVADKMYGKGTKARILERDGYRCFLQCNRVGRPLHIHHIDGMGHRSVTPNHDDANLVTICDSCHRRVEDLLSMGVDHDRLLLLLRRESPFR
jgi:5-methylcytosine-specific restriction endonuclease McrA